MKFTFLLPTDNLTGGARVVAVYARELQALGHEVLVVTCAPDQPHWRDRLTRVLGGARRAQPRPGHIALAGVPHRITRQPAFIGADDVPDGDVVVATWWQTAEWMDALPASKGRKVHLIQGYETWCGPALVPRVHAALRLPNVKVAISRSLKEMIEMELGPLGIEVIPNAVDRRQFDAAPRGRQAVPTVGFVYAQAYFKGADVCIRACELARQRLPQLRVVAFGADAPSPQLPLPAGADYSFRPSQDALRTLYSACDAWLFGSRLDSFGLPVVEAMACRTPVIAVPTGAAPDLLANGGGAIVAPESPEAMADAIVQFCTQPYEEWRRQSDIAHRVAHRHDWGAAARRLEALTCGEAAIA